MSAGEFLMGSSEGEGKSWERQQHLVKITNPLYLGKHEVTQGQYERIMGNNPSGFKGDADRPVENVSWDDAVAFCKKLSQKEGKTYRLPTEAEWEYACRAGSSTKWSFGDSEGDLGKYAWFDGNSLRATHPAGQKKPNAWGLHDMHGNVFEWCADWFGGDYYANSQAEDPTGPPSGASRVLRGGSWHNSDPDSCRCAYRLFRPPGLRYYSHGFRVARTLAPVPSGPISSESLYVQPVAPQAIEAGKEVSVAVAVKDAERWAGKLRYTLGANAPAGAQIAPDTGLFTWTPAEEQVPGKCDIAVTVEGPDGQREQAGFTVTVTRPSLTVDLGSGVTMEFVPISAGGFLMGSPKGEGQSSEHPQHHVRITKPFYLGKYEVTQRQYKRLMGDNPSSVVSDVNRPVDGVSWLDARAFCERLSEKEGKTYRLPTEAEWEYVCRAGSSTKWSFGDSGRDLGEYAWFGGKWGSTTHPVGKKRPNAWGLYDMHGNVWEWCADWYRPDYYAKSPAEDPAGPPSGVSRTLRGGSTLDSPEYLRCADRFLGAAEDRRAFCGFRVARTLSPKPKTEPHPEPKPESAPKTNPQPDPTRPKTEPDPGTKPEPKTEPGPKPKTEPKPTPPVQATVVYPQINDCLLLLGHEEVLSPLHLALLSHGSKDAKVSLLGVRPNADGDLPVEVHQEDKQRTGIKVFSVVRKRIRVLLCGVFLSDRKIRYVAGNGNREVLAPCVLKVASPGRVTYIPLLPPLDINSVTIQRGKGDMASNLRESVNLIDSDAYDRTMAAELYLGSGKVHLYSKGIGRGQAFEFTAGEKPERMLDVPSLAKRFKLDDVRVELVQGEDSEYEVHLRSSASDERRAASKDQAAAWQRLLEAADGFSGVLYRVVDGVRIDTVIIREPKR